MARIDWSHWAPPDRDAQQEVVQFFWGLGGGTVLAWVWFLSSYWSAWSELFTLENGRKVLAPGRMIADLPEIIGGSFLGLWAVLLWAVVTVALHYAGHYREGSRPVYLMRRLPDRWEYHRRCLAIPGIVILIALVLILVFLMLFYVIYMNCTPAACLAPDQWQKIWRVL